MHPRRDRAVASYEPLAELGNSLKWRHSPCESLSLPDSYHIVDLEEWWDPDLRVCCSGWLNLRTKSIS